MQYRLKLYRGNWAIVWSERGSTRRLSLGTDDREAAKVAYEDWVAKLSASPKPQYVTAGKILEGYFAARPKVFPRRWLLEFFRSTLPSNINRPLCERYIEFRSSVSSATIWSELGILSVALRWAVKEQWIERAPHIHRPPAPAPRDRWITKEEADKLIAACKAPHVRLFTEIATRTCARSGAILDLTWDRVNDRFIDFRSPNHAPTNKRRPVVPINAELKLILDEARKTAVSNYVIEYAGRQVGCVKQAFARAAARAHLEKVSPHTLRHSGATWMAMAGVDMRRISIMLGHSLQRTTEMYAKYAPDYLADAADALSRGRTVQLNR